MSAATLENIIIASITKKIRASRHNVVYEKWREHIVVVLLSLSHTYNLLQGGNNDEKMNVIYLILSIQIMDVCADEMTAIMNHLNVVEYTLACFVLTLQELKKDMPSAMDSWMVRNHNSKMIKNYHKVISVTIYSRYRIGTLIDKLNTPNQFFFNNKQQDIQLYIAQCFYVMCMVFKGDTAEHDWTTIVSKAPLPSEGARVMLCGIKSGRRLRSLFLEDLFGVEFHESYDTYIKSFMPPNQRTGT